MENKFLDGTLICSFFYNNEKINKNDYKNVYYLKDYCKPNNLVTFNIQSLIDYVTDNGGGLIVIDDIYYSGALYFKNNVHLYIAKNAKLIGSNNINDYPLIYTRIEGESGLYYPALLNFIGVSNIKIFGEGTIDGNGFNSWKSFWDRRRWNDKATNKDEQRPRLLFISNCNNITVDGLNFTNSAFWGIHLYKSEFIKILNIKIHSPEVPVKAPSTDGIDIDYCNNIIIKNNCFDVNDDAIALKGGKGPYADLDMHNGINEYIIIEDNEFQFCHSCLTLGSESIHNKDIIFRNNISTKSNNILWCKVRPDTPQIYENILLDNIKGYSRALIYIRPWEQFFDLKGRLDLPKNMIKNIHILNTNLKCDNYFKITKSEQYILKDFYFDNLNIECLISEYNPNIVDNIKINNVNIIEKYPNLEQKLEYIRFKIKSEHIKIIANINKPLFMISNAYPGVWLEHLYDSIMYGNLFNDFSIAKNTINAFLDLTLDNGQIPCFIKNDGSIGYSQIQECVSFTKLGFMIYEKTNDLELLKNLYNKSIKWVEFLYKYRMTMNTGLVEMFVGYDTGHDNSGRLDGMKYKGYYSIDGKRINADIKPDDNPIIAVDMNANLYNTLITLKDIAIILNDGININKFDFLARNLKKKLFEVCFDEEDCYFYDVDKNGKRKYLSSSIFHLFQERVLDKELDKDLIEKIYNKHIKNKNEFWTEYPFPAMAINDKSWESHKMPNSWGYYSQALIALRCSLWMDYYGFIKDYDHILYKWLEAFMKNYDKYPFSQEIDPITGDSSGASIWYSSSMILFLYIIKRLKLLQSHDIIPTF